MWSCCLVVIQFRVSRYNKHKPTINRPPGSAQQVRRLCRSTLESSRVELGRQAESLCLLFDLSACLRGQVKSLVPSLLRNEPKFTYRCRRRRGRCCSNRKWTRGQLAAKQTQLDQQNFACPTCRANCSIATTRASSSPVLTPRRSFVVWLRTCVPQVSRRQPTTTTTTATLLFPRATTNCGAATCPNSSYVLLSRQRPTPLVDLELAPDDATRRQLGSRQFGVGFVDADIEAEIEAGAVAAAAVLAERRVRRSCSRASLACQVAR